LRFLFVFLEKVRGKKKMRGKKVKKGESESVPIMMFTRLREQIEGNRLRNRGKIMRIEKRPKQKKTLPEVSEINLKGTLKICPGNLHNNAKMFAILPLSFIIINAFQLNFH
jgi:hypothetical protein